MKKKMPYEEPKSTIITFDVQDIITASGVGDGCGNNHYPADDENLGEWDKQ